MGIHSVGEVEGGGTTEGGRREKKQSGDRDYAAHRKKRNGVIGFRVINYLYINIIFK